MIKTQSVRVKLLSFGIAISTCCTNMAIIKILKISEVNEEDPPSESSYMTTRNKLLTTFTMVNFLPFFIPFALHGIVEN